MNNRDRSIICYSVMMIIATIILAMVVICYCLQDVKQSTDAQTEQITLQNAQIYKAIVDIESFVITDYYNVTTIPVEDMRDQMLENNIFNREGEQL